MGRRNLNRKMTAQERRQAKIARKLCGIQRKAVILFILTQRVMLENDFSVPVFMVL